MREREAPLDHPRHQRRREQRDGTQRISVGLQLPSPRSSTGTPREQAGIQHCEKETSDCKYLVHPFTGKHPESRQTNKPEGWDRTEYFSCFTPRAARGSWYLPDKFITRAQVSLDRTRQERSPRFLPKECFIDKFPQSLSVKRNSSIPKLQQSPLRWLCSSQGGQFQSNKEHQ